MLGPIVKIYPVCQVDLTVQFKHIVYGSTGSVLPAFHVTDSLSP